MSNASNQMGGTCTRLKPIRYLLDSFSRGATLLHRNLPSHTHAEAANHQHLFALIDIEHILNRS